MLPANMYRLLSVLAQKIVDEVARVVRGYVLSAVSRVFVYAEKIVVREPIAGVGALIEGVDSIGYSVALDGNVEGLPEVEVGMGINAYIVEVEEK